MDRDEDVSVRPCEPCDRDQVMALAPRLTEGVAGWRDAADVLTAVQGWLRGSMDAAGEPDHAVYVAVADGGVAGVVSVTERAHFTGQVDAYVGELVVRPDMARRGVATRLMAAAEAWAAGRGLAFITLDTGAGNAPARAFYTALGFTEEAVRLTKPVQAADQVSALGQALTM